MHIIGVGVCAHATYYTIYNTLIIGYDVENSANTFSIIFSTGLGDDLNAFNHTCRNRLKYLLRVVAPPIIRSSVLVYFEIRATIDAYFIFAVDGNHRNFAKHIENRTCFAFFVGFDVVA